nr:6K1 [Lupinus mosaic virus]
SKVSAGEAKLEKTIAVAALIMMIFDSERSDYLYKTLNKLKSLVRTVDDDVYHQ